MGGKIGHIEKSNSGEPHRNISNNNFLDDYHNFNISENANPTYGYKSFQEGDESFSFLKYDYQAEKLSNIENWTQYDWMELFYFISGDIKLYKKAISNFNNEDVKQLILSSQQVLFPYSRNKNYWTGTLNFSSEVDKEFIARAINWIEKLDGNAEEMDRERTYLKYVHAMEIYESNLSSANNEFYAKEEVKKRLDNIRLQEAIEATTPTGLDRANYPQYQDLESAHAPTESEKLRQELHDDFIKEYIDELGYENQEALLHDIIQNFTIYKTAKKQYTVTAEMTETSRSVIDEAHLQSLANDGNTGYVLRPQKFLNKGDVLTQGLSQEEYFLSLIHI